MKQSYIVIFEASNYAQVLEVIKSYGTWGKLSDNAWVVETAGTAVDIRERISNIMAPGGRVFVVKSGVEAAWQNMPADSDWLKQHL